MRRRHSVQNICIFILVLLLAGCGEADAKPDYVGEVSPCADGTYRWAQYVREEDRIMVLEFQMAE